jgi:ATP-dependent Clp protease ATP-binding subunit ClpA
VPLPQVGTEHVLLSLSASRSDAAAALGRAGASTDALRRAVEAASPVSAQNPLERMMRAKPGLPPPMAPDTERTLAAACRATPGASQVSAESLLRELIKDAGGGARRVLDGMGVTQQARARGLTGRARGVRVCTWAHVGVRLRFFLIALLWGCGARSAWRTS